MSFELQDFGIASSVYLALFVNYTAIAAYSVYLKGFDSLYAILCFYGIVRLGGQIGGVGFAVLGPGDYRWLVVYIVLTIEGYFVIVVAFFYLLCREQRKVWGKSPLEAPFKTSGICKDFSIRGLVHLILIVASVLLVIGGTMTSGMSIEDLRLDSGRVEAGEALRITGQTMFLLLSLMILGCAIYNFIKQRLRTISMKALLFITPFIIAKGIYGVMWAVLEDINYMALWNYFDVEKYREVTIFEYVLSTTTEFIAGFTLLNLIWVERRLGKVDDVSTGNFHSVVSGNPSKETDQEK